MYVKPKQASELEFLYLGCNIEEFKKHIEAQFVENMTWDNHGEWHIDKLIPLR
jgi:hypothetical protein